MLSQVGPSYLINSLAPGGFENIFQNVFFKLISWIDTLSNSCETALRSMPQNPSDDKSTLVQVMAWCRQAASHYLSQCCPRSLSPYGVTRPQWVNSLFLSGSKCHSKNIVYKYEFVTDSKSISIGSDLRSVYGYLMLTMDHLMAWCLTAPIHYLNKCSPRSITSYGDTMI